MKTASFYIFYGARFILLDGSSPKCLWYPDAPRKDL